MKTTLNYITMMAIVAAMTAASFALGATKETVTVPATNAITSGELIVDPPTLICLGFYWPIEGDDNHNAAVSIEFRKKSDTTWRKGLNLWMRRPGKWRAMGL